MLAYFFFIDLETNCVLLSHDPSGWTVNIFDRLHIYFHVMQTSCLNESNLTGHFQLYVVMCTISYSSHRVRFALGNWLIVYLEHYSFRCRPTPSYQRFRKAGIHHVVAAETWGFLFSLRQTQKQEHSWPVSLYRQASCCGFQLVTNSFFLPQQPYANYWLKHFVTR